MLHCFQLKCTCSSQNTIPCPLVASAQQRNEGQYCLWHATATGTMKQRQRLAAKKSLPTTNRSKRAATLWCSKPAQSAEAETAHCSSSGVRVVARTASQQAFVISLDLKLPWSARRHGWNDTTRPCNGPDAVQSGWTQHKAALRSCPNAHSQSQNLDLRAVCHL